MYEGILQNLIDEFGKLPGIGPKSAQRIAFHIIGAGMPVNAAHIFAPANDLTNEPFSSIDGHFARLISFFDRMAQFQRIKQSGVDVRRQNRMP